MVMVVVMVMAARIWTQADHHAAVAARTAHLRVGRRTVARRVGTTPTRHLSFHPSIRRFNQKTIAN